jgi:hypothetical protein
MSNFDKYVTKMLEGFDGLAPGVSPKPGRTVVAVGNNITAGDLETARFNSPKEFDLTLPSRKELNILKKIKSFLRKKAALKQPVYLPGKNKPGI